MLSWIVYLTDWDNLNNNFQFYLTGEVKLIKRILYNVFMKKQDKLRILAAGDLHGDVDIAKKLAEKAKKEKVDLVVLAGDLHGRIQGEGEMILPFKKLGQKVVFVPGNWDTTLEANLLRDIHHIKNIDGYYVTYKGVDIIGIGNPDMRFSLNNKSMEKLKNNFERIKTKNSRKILISHLHAEGSKAEFSGIRGEKILRKAIEYFEPDILVQAHIHEAEGIEEKIKKTKIFNVGRRGKVIEI